MRTLIRTVSLLTILVASLAALVPASSAVAAAPNFPLMVQRQVTLLETTADRVHATMVRVCETTVASVQRLDARNVPNATINKLGTRGTTQIDNLGNRTELSLERSTNRLITRLQTLNADQALIDQLNSALAQARTDLNASEAETKAPINAAVATATSN